MKFSKRILVLILVMVCYFESSGQSTIGLLQNGYVGDGEDPGAAQGGITRGWVCSSQS